MTDNGFSVDEISYYVENLLREKPDFQSAKYPNFSALLNFKASSERAKREALSSITTAETLKNAFIEANIMNPQMNPRYHFVQSLWISFRVGRKLSGYSDEEQLDEISVFTIKLQDKVEEYLACKKRWETITNQLSNDDYRGLRDILMLRHNTLKDEFDKSVFEMNKCRDNLDEFMNTKYPLSTSS